MWIYSSLVLGKESGVQHLSDVMIHGTGTHQLAVGTNAVGCGGSQVSKLQRMLECSGSNFRHLTHQLVVDVGKFHQGYIRSKSESLFQNKQ